jgi:hypothetical protein
MKKSIVLAAVLVVLGGACTVESSQAAEEAKAVPESKAAPKTVTAPIERGAVSGRRQRMGSFYSINPDCAKRGIVEVRIVAPPAHGRATLEDAKDFSTYEKDNVRFDCNRKEIPVIALFYVSDEGYSGADSFSAEALYPDGNTRLNTYSVDVWPAASASPSSR